MAGFFSGTGTNRELGRTARATRNLALGNTASMSFAWNYYSASNSNIQLSASFAGRFYPFTY
jgi:hypothetical protein